MALRLPSKAVWRSSMETHTIQPVSVGPDLVPGRSGGQAPALLPPSPAIPRRPFVVPRSHEKPRASWLPVVLVLAPIVFLVAAEVIACLSSAIARSKQRRTMSDMRMLATGLGSYKVDHGGYPAGSSVQSLKVLDPDYLVRPPTADGWGRPFRYEAPAADGLAATYTLSSLGKDGISQGVVREVTRYFDCDLVVSNGAALSFPEGLCGGNRLAE